MENRLRFIYGSEFIFSAQIGEPRRLFVLEMLLPFMILSLIRLAVSTSSVTRRTAAFYLILDIFASLKRACIVFSSGIPYSKLSIAESTVLKLFWRT